MNAPEPYEAPTVAKARTLREELESDILNLVLEFERATGTKVAALTVKRGDLPYYVGATVYL